MSADSLDLYRILQVDPAAHVDVIKAAYRVLARRYHPDLTGDDRVMKRLNSAWDVLSVPERRREYDRERIRRPGHPGAAGLDGTPGGPTGDPIVTPAPHAYAPDHAGPPPGNPSGRVLSFGRYEGWSLGEVARSDPRFLEWLRSVPAGRALRAEIDEALRDARRPRGLDGRATPTDRRGFEPAGAR